MSGFQMGDLVYSVQDLYNDPVEETGESAIPGATVGELLVSSGIRGVVVNVGHAEADPSQDIYLVSFEMDEAGTLSAPVGCLAEELSHEPAA
jgi:nitrogen fixation protein NifZ